MLRRIVFWSHLVVGLVVGLVVLTMSLTGVLLTYERQLLEWDEQRHTVAGATPTHAKTLDQTIDVVRQMHPDETHYFARLVNREGAAIQVWAGGNGYLMHPYTGEVIREGGSALSDFFHVVTDIHRWLALEGEEQGTGKAITAYSNLMFLFLIVSGIYLWLPRLWRWPILKGQMLFKSKYATTKGRDYSWHHVFAFWFFIPLLLIVCSATIFHFPLANQLIYSFYGEEMPVREMHEELDELVDGDLSYASLFGLAREHAAANGSADWYLMWMEFGEEEGKVRFFIDRSIGNQPELGYSLYLDNDTGEVLEVKRQTDWSRGDQAWDFVRFLHTGEVFGLLGQTIAGLASLAACILVYTGFALSWRRLVLPAIRRRRLALPRK